MGKYFFRTIIACSFLTLNIANAADTDVAAFMGDAQVKAGDIRGLLSLQNKEVQEKILDNPTALENLVRSEALRQAVLAEVRKSGWDKDPRVALVAERTKDQVLIDTYVGEMAKLPDGYPSAAEIEQYYNQNKSRMLMPAMSHLAQIFLPVSASDSAAKQKEVKAKIDQIKSKLSATNADFAEIARTYSLDKAKAEAGGDMGWVSNSLLLPEIRKEVALLYKGSVSKPLKTSAGWHIVKLIESKAEAVQSLAEASPAIIQQLRQKKFEEDKRAYLQGMLAKTPVKLADPQALKAMLAPKP